MPANSALAVLRDRVRREVPERPGVYTWVGSADETLYVGKSVNLRKRMLSYLAPGQAGPRSRVRHLAFAIQDFRYRETEGEFVALLLEDALIKDLQPRHNERSRDFRERRYLLLLQDHPGRRFAIVEDAKAGDGALFGPFKDRFFVAGLIALLEEVFGAALGGTGPAPRRVPDLAHVRAFLAGDPRRARARLSEALERACERLDFEHAATLRDQLAFCKRFAERQRFIERFRGGPLVVEERALGLTYRFDRGGLIEAWSGSSPSPVPAELRQPLHDARFLIDRANLVYDWLRMHPDPGGPVACK